MGHVHSKQHHGGESKGEGVREKGGEGIKGGKGRGEKEGG